MAMWNIEFTGKIPKLKNPVFIEGLPGIGNVGKLAVDFLIEEIKAKKIAEFTSFSFPHSVFINENNLVELPVIEVYYKKFKNKKKDLLILAGDVQPIDEESCYEFSNKVLEMANEFECSEIVTLGGIAMKTEPKNPGVFCTGNNKELITAYQKSIKTLNNDLYGVVGPIIGVSGVLLGLAGRKNMKAVSLLAETYGHPMYLGVKGTREILKILNKRFNLKLNFKTIDKEMDAINGDFSQAQLSPADLQRTKAIKKLRKSCNDVNYIG
ncbi:PAC2 family protein [Candidatus Woesearchaeota archaeon]|nr:PAC2 family protein [Candidatus Woesearchaeota archaeon]MBW3005231.1 PAC2 family protein [Candidatus Woesearchaeota archaeon]